VISRRCSDGVEPIFDIVKTVLNNLLHVDRTWPARLPSVAWRLLSGTGTKNIICKRFKFNITVYISRL